MLLGYDASEYLSWGCSSASFTPIVWRSFLPGRSVTLLTSSAREVADVVGVRHDGREKQSWKRIDAGGHNEEKVWLASFPSYTTYGVCRLINWRASSYTEPSPEWSIPSLNFLEIIIPTRHKLVACCCCEKCSSNSYTYIVDIKQPNAASCWCLGADHLCSVSK